MHLGEPVLSSLMRVLLGLSHIVSAFLHCPLEGSDLYSKANPRVDVIELLTVSPGVLVRHAWGEKHALSRTDYHYGVQNTNNGLEEILQQRLSPGMSLERLLVSCCFNSDYYTILFLLAHSFSGEGGSAWWSDVRPLFHLGGPHCLPAQPLPGEVLVTPSWGHHLVLCWICMAYWILHR